MDLAVVCHERFDWDSWSRGHTARQKCAVAARNFCFTPAFLVDREKAIVIRYASGEEREKRKLEAVIYGGTCAYTGLHSVPSTFQVSFSLLLEACPA